MSDLLSRITTILEKTEIEDPATRQALAGIYRKWRTSPKGVSKKEMGIATAPEHMGTEIAVAEAINEFTAADKKQLFILLYKLENFMEANSNAGEGIVTRFIQDLNEIGIIESGE